MLSLKTVPASPRVNTVGAALVLCRAGLTMLRSKRAVERAIEEGEITLSLPNVAEVEAVARELEECGLAAAVVAEREVDVRRLGESLRLTQSSSRFDTGSTSMR